MSQTRGGRIVTFYSYKGGTGRSMALSNLAWVLAANRQRVLLIDWDLEAPGLHRYFHPFLADQELSTSRGLIDLLADYADQAIAPESADEGADGNDAWYRERTDLAPYLQCINFSGFPEGGRIDLLPAGRQGAAYAVKLHAFDWDTFYERLGGGAFLEALKERLRESYDYVLIDSRTGVSDTAGICTVQMPDVLVAMFTYNNQSIRGALAVAQSAVDARRRVYGQFSHEAFRVFPVPSRADPFEVRKLQLRQAYARRLFAPLLEHLPERECNAYWTAVEVPYNAYLNYEEVLSPLIFNPDDPKLPLASVLRLASAVTDGAVTRYDLPISPEEKQQLLLAYEQVDEQGGAGTLAAAQTLAASETPSDALLRAADALLGQLTQSELALAGRLLLRLVRPPRGQEAAGLKRLLLPVDELPADERGLLDRFVQARVLRLVRSQDRNAAMAVEIADETLLTRWHQLNVWVEAEKAFLEQRYWIQAAWEQWQHAGQPDSLLLAAPLAEQAERLLATHTPLLSDAQIEFIKISRTFRGDEATNRETMRVSHSYEASGPAAWPAAWPAARRSGRRRWPWVSAAMLAVAVLIYALLPGTPQQGGNAPVDPPSPVPQTGPTPPANLTSAASVTAGGFYIAGEQSLAAGRLDEAIDNFSTALKLNAAFPEVLFKRAHVYQLKNDPDKAIADLSAGLKLRPDQADAHLMLAGLLAAKQDKQGAARQYQAALALDLNPEQRQQASQGLDKLNPASASPQVYLHINNRADYPFAEKLAGQLKAAGAETRGIEVLAQSTNADVRYANLADERLARQIRDRVQLALDQAAYQSSRVELLYIGNSAKNIPLGRIEVWLPPLSAAKNPAPSRRAAKAE